MDKTMWLEWKESILMPVFDFEDRLSDLIREAKEADVEHEVMLSALELAIYSLNEELDDPD